MTIYRFAEFTLDPGTRKLFRERDEIVLNDRAFEILLLLIDERPLVLSKDAIIDRVWKGLAVEDNSVERAIVNIRKALGDDAANAVFVKTVRGRGYHFVCDVTTDRERSVQAGTRNSSSYSNQRRSSGAGRLWLALSVVMLSAIIVGAWSKDRLIEFVTSDVIFREDFSGKDLDASKWMASGDTVRVDQGIARLTVDRIDRGGRLESAQIRIDPRKPLTIKSRAKISFNQSVNSNVDFIGTLGFEFGSRDPNGSSLIGVKYANAEGEFCYPGNITRAEGFYLVRDDGDVRINRHHNEGKIGPQTAPVWDRWLEQELRYDPDGRMLSLTIDGEMKSRFAITEAEIADGNSIYLTIFPRGWWLHHSIEIDYIELSQPKSFAMRHGFLIF